jgi:hypothetical protein
MDLSAAINDLRIQKEQIERAITHLEDLLKSQDVDGSSPKRRGRKGMGPEERLAVSKRMKRYWERRRKLRSK